MKSVIRDTFDVRPETFWQSLFFDPEYVRRLYLEALGCESVDLTENTVDERNRRARKLLFRQKLDAPAPIRKIFGESTTMEERGQFDPETKRWCFEMIPDRMPDKVRITGETWVEPAGADALKVERICAVDFSVSIFGIGSLVEKFMASATAESYVRQAAFTRAFIAEKKLA
jgi:hypothetical protein